MEKGEAAVDRFSEAHDPNQQLFTAKIPQLMHKYEASRNVYIVSYRERERIGKATFSPEAKEFKLIF